MFLLFISFQLQYWTMHLKLLDTSVLYNRDNNIYFTTQRNNMQQYYGMVSGPQVYVSIRREETCGHMSKQSANSEWVGKRLVIVLIGQPSYCTVVGQVCRVVKRPWDTGLQYPWVDNRPAVPGLDPSAWPPLLWLLLRGCSFLSLLHISRFLFLGQARWCQGKSVSSQ